MTENPIVDQMLKMKSMEIERIHRPLYFAPPMNNSEANSVDWLEFRQRILPLVTLKFNNSQLDYLITPKSYSFGLRDVNIFIGEQDREVNTITDLSVSEGANLLMLNQILVNKLLDEGQKNIQVTLGFNPEDVSLLGNHTLKRLHTHLYLVEDSILQKNLSSVSWKDLNWFDRFSLVEPFSKIAYDFLLSLKKQNNLFPNQDACVLEENLGFTSIDFSNKGKFQNMFSDLTDLYSVMKSEYNRIQDIFTDKTLDTVTQRYLPRRKEDRLQRLDGYLEEQDYLSDDSVRLLNYLAKNLVPAAPGREKGIISRPNQIWISKGFSGALTFSFSDKSDGFRLDIIPRAITTACSSKTLCGKDKTVIFGRDRNPATEQELAEIRDYWQTIQTVVGKELPNNISDHKPI